YLLDHRYSGTVQYGKPNPSRTDALPSLRVSRRSPKSTSTHGRIARVAPVAAVPLPRLWQALPNLCETPRSQRGYRVTRRNATGFRGGRLGGSHSAWGSKRILRVTSYRNSAGATGALAPDFGGWPILPIVLDVV